MTREEEWAGADADLLSCGHVCNEDRWRDILSMSERHGLMRGALDAMIRAGLSRAGRAIRPPWKEWAERAGVSTGKVHAAVYRMASERILRCDADENNRVRLALRHEFRVNATPSAKPST